MAIKIIAIKTTGNEPVHITQLKTEHNSTFTREEMYQKVKNGGDYKVDISPFPRLEDVIHSNGTRYVRSKGDGTSSDNLMKLPRF